MHTFKVKFWIVSCEFQHLGVDEVPEDDSYDEMICAGCMKKYDFLWAYTVDSKGNGC